MWTSYLIVDTLIDKEVDVKGSPESVALSPSDVGHYESNHNSEHCTSCNYLPPKNDKGPLGLSRDTWAKLIVWFIPIVFASGALFFSFQNMNVRVSRNSDGIQRIGDQQQEMHTDQSVHETKLDTIKEVQGELKENVKKLGDKIDDQKDDLSAIREKMNIPKKE